MRESKADNQRILFLGQKPVGERCFDILIERLNSELHLCAAVSNEKQRSGWWCTNGIYRKSVARRIPFVANETRNTDSIRALVRSQGINCIISVQHPWILPKDILETVEYRAFNIHNAPLPDYKGHNAANHAILNAERTFCSTLHWMIESVDEGSLIKAESFDVTEDDTAWSVYNKGNAAAERAFRYLLDLLESKAEIPRSLLSGSRDVFYDRHSVEEHKEIRNSQDVDEVSLKSRACFFPGFEIAWFKKDGYRFFVAPEPVLPANPHFKNSDKEGV